MGEPVNPILDQSVQRLDTTSCAARFDGARCCGLQREELRGGKGAVPRGAASRVERWGSANRRETSER